MFGIRGLDGFGLVHGAIGIAALLLGFAVVMLRKGTVIHRRIGITYLIAMSMLNVTALWIFDLTGSFGPFHVAAVISLATLLAGYAPLLLRHKMTDWIAVHAIFMSWSYVGLLAAFISELAVRVPGLGLTPTVVGVSTAITVAGGALVIHSKVPALARGLATEFKVRAGLGQKL